MIANLKINEYQSDISMKEEYLFQSYNEMLTMIHPVMNGNVVRSKSQKEITSFCFQALFPFPVDPRDQ